MFNSLIKFMRKLDLGPSLSESHVSRVTQLVVWVPWSRRLAGLLGARSPAVAPGAAWESALVWGHHEVWVCPQAAALLVWLSPEGLQGNPCAEFELGSPKVV